MFKTYDSDIEGITNKLGFSKRSFAEWGEQVSSAFTESEGKMNKFKNTLSAVFVPKKDNTKLIGDFQAFKDLMLETGLSAEELAKEVGGVDSRIVSYAKSGEVGKLTTDGFKESIGNLSLGAKAGQVALNGLALVGNTLAMAFASWVATEIISWLNDLAHAEENARKRSEELTSSYETEKKDIDDSIAKYKELSEKLNDSSLSTSEVKSIKEQLLSVQDQLNEKYGAEAAQIDLVNGKYDEQIKKLDALAKKKASDYVSENYKDIQADQKYVSEKVNLNKSLGFKGSQARPDDYSNAGFDLKKYLDRYDKLSAKVVNPDGQYGMTGDVNLVTNGTRQEIYDQLSQLFQDLSNDFGNSNEDVNKFKTTISGILEDSFDTDALDSANDRIKKYAQAEILSNDDASASYNNLVDAVDNYNTALSSGKGVDDAKQKLLEAKQAAEDSTKDITNSGKVLQDVYNSLDNEAPIELQVEFGKNVDEDLQQSYDDTINRFKDSNKIKDFFDTEGINTQDEIDAFNDVTKGISDADEAIKKWTEDKQDSEETSTSFEIPDAETLKQQISDLNSAIDSIQSAYDTLNSAVEEYNTNGGTLSIDTIQSLLSLSDDYLACLQVENGQLSLNADAMAQLAQAKLDDAQATAVTQAMTELDTIAKGENSSANSAYISGNAALMSSLAQLSGSYDGVAKAAMTAAQAQRLSALISDAAGKDKTATENVMKGLDTKLKLIQTTKASISAGNFGKVAGKSSSSSKGSGSDKSASDTAKEEIEAYMEYLEKALEGGRITYSDYVRDVTLKLDDMYHNGRITAKEYFDYVEKRLNQQLEVYKSVLSAVTDLLEDEAQKWQDKIDALNDENDLLEKQKDDYDSILSAVDQIYQDEIDRLNEQKDLLQDKIDAINDENDALELQRKKQEALIALDKARQQRNVKIYAEGRGYFYDIDQDAYKDAQQNLQDIKNEEVIKKLEDEQDALDDSIELLEKYRDLWNDIADAYKKKTNEALAVALWGENYEKLILQNRTQDIEAFKDKYLEIQSKIDDNKSLIDSYQEKVDYYNKLKEQWSDISSAYEKEQQRMYAAQILGANWEKDVLDGRLDVLSQFRDQYLEIQRQMTQAALDGARARNDAAASGGTGGSGGSSGGGGGSTPIQNQQAYHVLHLVGGYSTSGEASSKISSFNGKGVYKYKDGKWYVYKEEDYSNLSFGSKSEADDYIKKHLSPAGRFLVKYYHNGLENGLVDFNKKDSNFDLVQKYGLKKYEVPAILKQGEAVMNQEQIKNLGEALRSIPTAATLYKTPNYTKMMSSLKTNNTPVMVTQSVNITLPNVTNNSGYENLTRELNRLKLDAYQFANRRN